MRLDPLVDVCDLKIRESREGGVSRWAVTATCKQKELPPPVMLP
jgi:hypothetical protein